MFNVGDKVVYPHHGAGVVEKVETRSIEGERKKYFVLSLCRGDLRHDFSSDRGFNRGFNRSFSGGL